jgi:hypothetical protein
MEPRKSTARGGTRARNTCAGGDVAGGIDEPRTGTLGTSGTSSTSSGIAGKVKERATAQLTTQKDRATDGLGTVASAVRQTGQHLREQQNETVAQYVEKAAEQLERLSNNLREKDVNELLHDAQRLARRQPALFIGGSFAVGLLAARFLKSSRAEGRDYDVGTRDYYTTPGAY